MIGYSESLNRKRIEDLFAQDIMDLNINRIKDLPPIDLYKALLLKKKHKEKGKLFETIFRGVEFIEQIKISFKDDFNYILTNFKKYDESFYSNSENVARWYDSQVTNTKPDDLLKDKFFTEFFELYHIWANQKDFADLRFNQENFVTPLIKVIKKYPTDSRTLQIMPFVYSIDIAIKNHLHLCDLMSKKIKEDAENLQKYYNESKADLEELLNIRRS